MGRERARAEVLGFGAGVLGFPIAAVVKMPVAAQPRTGRARSKGRRDFIPADEPVFGGVCGSVGVADALELADPDEPVDEPGRVALGHSLGDLVSREARPNGVEVVPWSEGEG